MIDKLKSQHAVQRLCQQLNVAMSGYLAHSQGRPSSERKQQDQRLLVYIRAAHARGRGIYGPLKIQTELAAQGVTAGINRIKRLRALHGIRCTHKKKFRVTTDAKHLMPVARNLLDRQFACTAPNELWVADITYIPTGDGWLYLAAVKDLYTCEIVGWAMDNRMTQTLVMDALTAAYWKKKPAPGLMHHSDRGSQYCSAAYRALQASFGIQTSMSRKVIVGTTRRWKASLAPSKLKVCIIIVLKPEKRLKGLSLSTLKYSIIAFGDMQKLVIKYLLTSPVSITLAIKLQHNSDDLPLY